MTHDPTLSHDIFATFAQKAGCARHEAKAFLMVAGRYERCYERILVQTTTERATDPVDTFVATLEGIDGAGPDATILRTLGAMAPGELRLALEVIFTALKDASNPGKPVAQEEARAWLEDGSRLYSARFLIETLGGDYDAIVTALRKRWKALDEIEERK